MVLVINSISNLHSKFTLKENTLISDQSPPLAVFETLWWCLPARTTGPLVKPFSLVVEHHCQVRHLYSAKNLIQIRTHVALFQECCSQLSTFCPLWNLFPRTIFIISVLV